VKFAFIAAHQDQFPIEWICQVLGVSRSGYYAWRDRPPSAQARRRDELTEQIRQAYQQSHQTYGSPRVHRALAAWGVPCCEKTVAKLMRLAKIRSKVHRRFVVRTTDSRHDQPVAENLLARRFTVERPDTVWAADMTYVPTAQGWLYLAVVLDLCSRKVVGWATADHLRTELVQRALAMALVQRRPHGSVLHHSDRGVQYASDAYQGLLAAQGFKVSMSRRGACYDNAVVESFFSTLKRELIHHQQYANHEEAHRSLFEYIEVFYNRQRRHSALGYRSPTQFETTLN